MRAMIRAAVLGACLAAAGHPAVALEETYVQWSRHADLNREAIEVLSSSWYKIRRSDSWLGRHPNYWDNKREAVEAAGGSLAAPAPRRNLILTASFEAGSLWPMRSSSNGNPVTVSDGPARRGRRSARVVLDRDSSRVPYRTEMLPNPTGRGAWRAEVGGTYWYGFSIHLPSDYAKDPLWEIVTQWHDAPDPGETYRNPILSLSTTNDAWTLHNKWDYRRITPSTGQRYTGSMTWHLGPLRKGRWTDWVVQVKWSYTSTGFLNVWKDGRKVVSRRGPNCFNDRQGPNLQMGMYKGWKENQRRWWGPVSRRVLYMDEVRIGDFRATYRDVAP